MADLYTFSEEGMRKLVAAYREQQRDMVNLKRHLAHYATRRHEAVYLPGSAAKLVTPISTLYAAFGGGIDDENYNPNLDYANVDSNALAISTGNYIAVASGSTATGRNRVVYPGNCYVWEFDADGILRNSETTIECINLTGLPIMGATWCLARKLHGSDYWAATKIGELASASKDFLITPGTTLVAGGEAKIIRYAPSLKPEGTTTGNQDWAYFHGNDVFIHHPGTYTITFGAQVTRYNSPTADVTRYTDSDDADYIDLPNPADVEICCLQNWNPSVDSLAAWPQNERLIYMSLPAKGGGCSSERTFTINHTLDTWHGQPYMRLSLAMKVTGYGTTPADTEVNFRQGWIHIRPEGGAYAGNEGTGYNAFLGASGAHQWWGGGTEPGDFDEDGVAIP
jgi:hypothetical protein